MATALQQVSHQSVQKNRRTGTFTTVVDGLDAVVSDFTDAAAGIELRAGAIVTSTALAVQRDARAAAPVRTGQLRDSIIATVAGSDQQLMLGRPTLDAEVGPSKALGGWYAHIVEFGTSHSPPDPFMFNSVETRLAGMAHDLYVAAAAA